MFNNEKSFLFIITYNIKIIAYLILMNILKIFPVDNKKIIVVSYHGKGYGDNGKYIVEELLKSSDKLLIYWATIPEYKNSLPTNVKYVKYNSIKYLYILSTSKVWINNCRFSNGTVKRSNQFYIQTWHAGLGLKKVEKKASDLSKIYIKTAQNDSKMIDVLISNCKYRTNIFKTDFWYDGLIEEIGLPRNDIFFDSIKKDEIKNKINNHFNLRNNDVILLYAPTFRSNSSINPYDIDFEKLIEDYNRKYNVNLKVLIRLHPNIANKKDMFNYDDSIINATDYPDIQELIIASKMIITDYSSCMFDAMLCDDDVYLYAPDYSEYAVKRGFTFNYQELPFSIAYRREELINNILNNDAINHRKELEQFKNDNKIADNGNASKIIAKRVNEVINGGINNEKI